jgi:hypothetical protein
MVGLHLCSFDKDVRKRDYSLPFVKLRIPAAWYISFSLQVIFRPAGRKMTCKEKEIRGLCAS